jgi:tetratricopeptide (TPR) repeat protein
LAEEVYSTLCERLSSRHPEALAALRTVALIHADRGAWEQAEALFGDLAHGIKEGLPREMGFVAAALVDRARCLRELKRFEEAQCLLQEAWRGLEAEKAPARARESVARGFAGLYQAWGKAEEAAWWEVRVTDSDPETQSRPNR